MPFNTQYYFHRALFYLTTPLIIVLLYFFGSTPEYFDWIYIGALGLSCVFCWNDKDTLGALAILLGLWVFSRLFALTMELSYALFCIYFASILITYYCIGQLIAKVFLVLIMLSIGCEFYWVISNYPNKPLIAYFIGTMALTILAREMLFHRVLIAHRYFGYISGKIALDWQLRGILLADCILIMSMLTEYLVRHILGFTNVTFIYNNFTLSATILSSVTLTIVYMHFFYNQSKKHLQA